MGCSSGKYLPIEEEQEEGAGPPGEEGSELESYYDGITETIQCCKSGK